MIEPKPFKEQHRRTSKAFSRIRKLTCSRMRMFILKKSVKSIQLRLNKWFEWLRGQTVSSSAYTQARSNLKHPAFIALNELMLSIFYREGDYRRSQGFRWVAIEGSQVRLPESQELKERFGAIRYRNQQEGINGEHNYSRGTIK